MVKCSRVMLHVRVTTATAVLSFLSSDLHNSRMHVPFNLSCLISQRPSPFASTFTASDVGSFSLVNIRFYASVYSIFTIEIVAGREIYVGLSFWGFKVIVCSCNTPIA